MSTATPRHTNRLAQETSPYLLQHAHNPVDWYPWGPEALERARKEDKPILLSVGYAACHWCHVMERESFEDESIAKLMNESFVCIKVDREERPDVDDIYMAATVAMSGSGGWPMTVFLTPEQQPFFAGTYFPPTDKFGRPGFPTLLTRIAEVWREDRESLEARAAELTEHVREQSQLGRAASVSGDVLSEAVKQLSAVFDPRWGGFGAAPKFPPTGGIELLLRHHRRTGDAESLRMVERTLDGMKNGGIYDHLAGGFARYSTDERWLAPHFEKMLYDNALLARVYLWAHQVTASPEYRRVASETLDYILSEMQSPDGGYFSATDADSEGEEGKFFVWEPEELEAVLGEVAARHFAAFYDVSTGGNWEGKSILNTPSSLEDVARRLELSPEELSASLRDSRQKLYAARSKRVPPLLDDKVLTAWNGLMIGAMAEGHRVLRDPRYLESAERAARFVLGRMTRPDGRLLRTSRAGKAHLDAYLEDYAYFGDALLDLYEAGGATKHLARAAELAERMLEDFGDPEAGAFYFTARDHEQLIARTREGHDGAIPNANAVAARLLARLSVHLDREDLRERAALAIRAHARLIERSPRSFATSVAVVDFLLEPPTELVLVGDGEAAEALAREVARHYLPNRICAIVREPRSETLSPLASGKELVEGQPALYVCRDYACQAPITDPTKVAEALGDRLRLSAQSRAPSLSARRVSGFATEEGTRAYCEKRGEPWGATGYAQLGTTGLTVSRLGFGGYRIDERATEHRSALAKALLEGVNLLDTSTNYTDGSSERLMGEVLRDLIDRGELWRDQIVVVSKMGYVQSKNLELAEEREREGRPFPEMVKVGTGIWHCLHPEWLEDQLERSLDRLGLDTLDVCLLHNPEYFLAAAVKRGEGPIAKLRDELYRRFERAFSHFEKEVQRGRIRFYGVSSNTAVSPADDRDATELSRMLEAAEKAGGAQHHFRVLQLPFNLLEPGAALEKNNADGSKTVLELALEKHIGVLVNRPLNAILGDALVRLADPPRMAGALAFDAALAQVAELEEEFRETLAPSLRTAPGTPPPESLFNWAEQLARLPASASTLAQWNDVERQVVLPRTHHVLAAMDRAMRGDAEPPWRSWKGRYAQALDALLFAGRQRACEQSRKTSEEIHRSIEPHLPPSYRNEPLSRLALYTLTNTPGVSSVLVGMRSDAYVDDAVAVLGWEAWDGSIRALEALAKARPGTR